MVFHSLVHHFTLKNSVLVSQLYSSSLSVQSNKHVAGLALTGVSKNRNPLKDIMNAVTILKGNPDKIKDICKKLFAPEPDKNGMLYIQSKNN